LFMLPAKIDERFHIAIKNGKKSEKRLCYIVISKWNCIIH
jgi:hypothetical protein